MSISLSANLPQGLTLQAPQSDLPQLRAGQVVEARVVSNAQGGNAQLALGNQLVDVDVQIKLQEGALLRLLVQATSPSVRLAVLPQQQPGGQGTGLQAGTQATPDASVRANPQNQPSRQPVPAPRPSAPSASGQPAGNASVPTANARPTSAEPLGHPVSSRGQAPANAQPLPTAQPAPATAPNTGQAAAVAARAGVSVGQANPAPALQPGTILQLQTSGSGPLLRPVLAPVSAVQAQQAKPANPQAVPVASASAMQQAIFQTAQSAVARQDSISALLASLAGLGGKLSEQPKPVARAGAELLGSRLALDGKPLDGATLKQAIQRSGVLLENTLLKGGPAPQGDIKSGLLKLTAALRSWLGDSAATQKAETGNRPPPPTGGAPPRADRPAMNALLPDMSARDAGTRLLAQGDAALSRLRLMQISSLPDAIARGGQSAVSSPELNIELPLLLGSELGIGQFQVLRDGKNGAGRDADGAWKMRFSINFSLTGEVGATVSLRGSKVGVMIWAEREDVAEALEEATGDLQAALEARGLKAGAIRCRHGHPPQAKAPAGYFMDDCS